MLFSYALSELLLIN